MNEDVPVGQSATMYDKTPAKEMNGYMSNPFLVTAKGIILILWHNPISSLLATLAMVSFFFGFGITFGLIAAVVGGVTGVVWLFALLAIVPYVFLIVLFGSMFTVIAVKSIQGETVTTNESMHLALHKFPKVMAAMLLSFLVLIPAYLLLIIPGLYLAGRLTLTLFLIFEEDLGPINAMKRSMQLTRGHVVEIWGATIAGGLVSGGGLLGPATAIAPLAGRYFDLKQLQISNDEKPRIHWLNYFLIVVTPIIMAGYLWLNYSVLQQNIKMQNQIQQTNGSGVDNTASNSQGSLIAAYDQDAYVQLVNQILQNDQEALSVITTAQTASSKEYIAGLDKSLTKLSQNLALTVQVKSLPNLPQALLDRNELTIQYTNLRIKDFELRKKAEIEQSNQYNAELDSINSQIQELLAKLNTQ